MMKIMVLDADFNGVWAPLASCLWRHPLKRDFLDIYLTTFLESVPSKMQNLWGSFFYLKCSKVHLDFKNATENREKAFSFLDNCIGIGILNLSLWRTIYISSAAYSEYDKGAVMRISTVLGHVYHVACRRILWNGTF